MLFCSTFIGTCFGIHWNSIHHNCEGVCEVKGHGHFTNIDGLGYLYPGYCDYILAQVSFNFRYNGFFFKNE